MTYYLVSPTVESSNLINLLVWLKIINISKKLLIVTDDTFIGFKQFLCENHTQMSYSDCFVVNTWGIIESCHYKPFNVYASYNSMQTYPQFRGLIDAVKSGEIKLPSIFCHPNAAKEFVQKYLDLIDFPFVLVTSHYDSDMPIDALTNNEISQLLNNRNLVRWYTQNCVMSHPKITSLAIGLDYHTLTNAHPIKGHIWGKRETPIGQETTLLILRSQMKPLEKRELKCYSTCHINICKGHGQDRIDAMHQVPTSLLYLEKHLVPRETSWINQMQFAFVLSPHGNGLDCHRTWEAIALGCIPVVKTSPLDCLFAGLPVLIVKSWTDVTDSLLRETVERFKDSIKSDELPEKLKLEYWTSRIAKGDDIE